MLGGKKNPTANHRKQIKFIIKLTFHEIKKKRLYKIQDLYKRFFRFMYFSILILYLFVGINHFFDQAVTHDILVVQVNNTYSVHVFQNQNRFFQT